MTFSEDSFNVTKNQAFYPPSLLFQSPSLKLTVCMILFLCSISLAGLVFLSGKILRFVNMSVSTVMVAACLYFFSMSGWGYDSPWLMTTQRIPAGYLLFAVFAVLFFDRQVLKSRLLNALALGRSGVFAVLVFCATVAGQDVRFSMGFRDYLDKFYAAVNTPPAKIMRINETAIPERFSWGVTNELQSVVLADTYPCGIILSKDDASWAFKADGNMDKTRPPIIPRSPYFAKGFSWSGKEN
jgi:hypothetical protein